MSAETEVKGTLAGDTPRGHVGAAAGVPQYIPSSLTHFSLHPISGLESQKISGLKFPSKEA